MVREIFVSENMSQNVQSFLNISFSSNKKEGEEKEKYIFLFSITEKFDILKHIIKYVGPVPSNNTTGLNTTGVIISDCWLFFCPFVV